MAGKGEGSGPVAETIDAHVLVIEARYYEDIAEELLAGAVAVLEAHGATHERIAVPGALEIPQVLALAAEAGRLEAESARPIEGVIVLGCVIRGETAHYDIVCNNANHWLMQVATDMALPVGNAILTVDTKEQALARATGGSKGKGGDAARACLRLIEISRHFAEDAQ